MSDTTPVSVLWSGDGAAEYLNHVVYELEDAELVGEYAFAKEMAGQKLTPFWLQRFLILRVVITARNIWGLV